MTAGVRRARIPEAHCPLPQESLADRHSWTAGAQEAGAIPPHAVEIGEREGAVRPGFLLQPAGLRLYRQHSAGAQRPGNSHLRQAASAPVPWGLLVATTF